MSTVWSTVILATFFFAVALPGAVSAASFDCNHVTSPREHLICSDPVLSDLDSRLGQTYQHQRALLSPEGAKTLQSAERSWLRFVAAVCPPVAPAQAGGEWTPNSCLQSQYQGRLRQLEKIQRLGPFIFNHIDNYAAEPAPDHEGSVTGFYVHHVAYPHIDNSSSAVVTAVNNLINRKLSKRDPCDIGQGDDDTDYDISFVSEHVISIQWINSVYCHETPHGMFDARAQNIILQPSPHLLKETDLFGENGEWVSKLQKLFWNALLAKGFDSPVSNIEQQIGDIVIKPNRWVLTAQGLEVSFSSGEGGCSACNPGPVTISWADLKPIMARDAVMP